jgi:hypothetical protein
VDTKEINMSRTQKIASLIAAAGVLLVGVGKFMAGEIPNWTEVTLAITTILAAIGYQRP